MSENREWKTEEDQEEEEYDEEFYKAQKDAVLFAIDVSKTMLTAPQASDTNSVGTDSPTAAALKCAYQIMQQRIISNPKDMMGLLLFGTEQSKFQEESENSRGALEYPNCYLLSDLDIPSAEDVKLLRDLTTDDEEANKLLVPSTKPVSMGNMLFCANQVFTTKAPNFGSRRLFIITDNDNPHSDDKDAKIQAQTRAKDLYDLGVIIELFPISRPDHEFDRKNFYDDIVYRDPNEEHEGVVGQISLKTTGGNGISLLNSLVSDINSKQVAKRALFSNLPFEIGPGFKITVKGYNMIQKQKPIKSHWVYEGGEQAQIAIGSTKKLTVDDTAREVKADEMRKAYKFGGDAVLFEPEEQNELKNFGPPGLRVIGFKPQSLLPSWASIKKSTFIYPSDNDYIGSTRVFSALWQKLLKDKKMGLGWFIARKNAKPLLVAILPSSEKLDALTGAQVVPQGLWLYQLPFADDLRNPPAVPTPVVAPDELINEMRHIMQQLQLPKATYDPSKYPNPSLQWHYRVLQAAALGEDLPVVPEDKTIPKYKQIHKRAGEYVHAWAVVLDEQSRAYADNRRRAGSVKRGRDEDDAPPAKKAKTVKGDLADMSVEELKSLVSADKLGKYTVAALKELCAAKGLSATGVKSALIERVEQWVEEN